MPVMAAAAVLFLILEALRPGRAFFLIKPPFDIGAGHERTFIDIGPFGHELIDEPRPSDDMEEVRVPEITITSPASVALWW